MQLSIMLCWIGVGVVGVGAPISPIRAHMYLVLVLVHAKFYYTDRGVHACTCIANMMYDVCVCAQTSYLHFTTVY